jgi:hypothetical protein
MPWFFFLPACFHLVAHLVGWDSSSVELIKYGSSPFIFRRRRSGSPERLFFFILFYFPDHMQWESHSIRKGYQFTR